MCKIHKSDIIMAFYIPETIILANIVKIKRSRIKDCLQYSVSLWLISRLTQSVLWLNAMLSMAPGANKVTYTVCFMAEWHAVYGFWGPPFLDVFYSAIFALIILSGVKLGDSKLWHLYHSVICYSVTLQWILYTNHLSFNFDRGFANSSLL